MAAKCGACGKFLRPTGSVECTKCPRSYHKACVGFLDANVAEKGWVCPECKRVQPRGDNTNTPVKGATTPLVSPLPGESSAGSSSTLPAPVHQPSTNADELMRELREFRAEFRSYREGMAQRMDAFEKRLTAVEQREAAPAQEEITELRTVVALLKAEVNDRDQELLLSDVDIGHLPECPGENVIHTVTVLAAKLGVQVQEQDIVFAERVGRPDRNVVLDGASAVPPRRVVVRLARRALRDRLLQAARVRRTLSSSELGLAGPSTRIYVNERLTKSNRQLFHQVREECRRRQWRFAWTKQGRVYVRQADGKQVFQIRSDSDMVKVFSIKAV